MLNTKEAMLIEMPLPSEPWVTPAQVAQYLGFSKALIVRMAEDGEIPGYPFQRGKKTFWRFKLTEVDRALRQRAV